jgi:hypothetical protein
MIDDSQIREPWIGVPPTPPRKRLVFAFTSLGRVHAEILLRNCIEKHPDLPLPIADFAKIF